MKGILIVVAALCFGVVSHASQLQSKVDLKIVPASPIVITGDVQVGGAVIKAPWFSFQLQVTNSSGKPLTLVAVETDVTASTVSSTATFTPSNADYKNGNVSCDYDGIYDEIPPDGRPHVLTATLTAGDVSCPSTVTPRFYVGNNPLTGSYQYNVTVKPQGWFGTANDPESRFDQSVEFVTQ